MVAVVMCCVPGYRLADDGETRECQCLLDVGVVVIVLSVLQYSRNY